MKNQEKYFYTTSFPLACFLFSKDIQMSEPVDLDHQQKEFVFKKTGQLEELVNIYKFGKKNDTELLISVHTYEQSRRELLDVLNN